MNRSLLKFKNILFDFDGVIVENSQTIGMEILSNLINSFQLSIHADELIENYLGMKNEDILADIKLKHHVDIPLTTLTDVRKQQREYLLQKALTGKGLNQLLLHAENKYICSSNTRAFINSLLHALELKKYFPEETIYSLDDVSKPKPSPEVYLAALHHHDLKIEESCAIEDSIVGVQAAKSAGLYTFGYIGGLPEYASKKYANDLRKSGADCIISTLWTSTQPAEN